MFYLLLTLSISISVSQGQPSVSSVCLQEPDTGSCRAYLPSYYFNAQTGSCDCFVYGGCAPGGNNFETLEMCMATCGLNQATQVMSRECRRILSNVNVARPISPPQNAVQSPGSTVGGGRPSLPPSPGPPTRPSGSGQRPPSGGSSVSVSNKHPDFNETTIQQLQTIFNEISGSEKPSNQEVARPQAQQQPSQQRVPSAGAPRPVFPPPSPGASQPVRPPKVSQPTGNRERPPVSPGTNQALQRQIEQQKELERQLQQTIQQHQQLQQQQQRQQQEQLLQQQQLQRQQQLQGSRKQPPKSG